MIDRRMMLDDVHNVGKIQNLQRLSRNDDGVK